jgi:hypothetical protein
LNAKAGARVLAVGRVALGAALLLAPRHAATRWVGEHIEHPAVRALVRSIGVRDVVLGMIALHTVEHPEVGPRWQATCATVDGVDLLATGAARGDLPAAGVAGTAALAGGAAVAGLYISRALRPR